MTEFNNFAQGYKNALTNLERYIESSINRNGGARTPQQVVRVLNDTIVYIHQEVQSVSDVELEKEEELEFDFENVEDVINAIVQGKLVFVGGKH